MTTCGKTIDIEIEGESEQVRCSLPAGHAEAHAGTVWWSQDGLVYGTEDRPTFDQALRDPAEQFDPRSELLPDLLRSIGEYRDAPSGTASLPRDDPGPCVNPDCDADGSCRHKRAVSS